MTAKKSHFKLSPLISIITLITSPSFAGQNFLIAPNGSQPSVITAGSTVTANYLLTNLTNSTRSGYSIRGLPATVVQDTSPGNCPILINLAAKASCNLVFTISAPVSSNFAICKGNSCTTASQPISVSLLGRMIAGGGYLAMPGSYPLLSEYFGTAWVYPSTIITNFPSGQGYVSPIFHTTACGDTRCIAAGNDTSNSGYLPFVAISPEGIDDWTYPIRPSSGSYPPDISSNFGTFVGSACVGNDWCVAVGQYTAVSLSQVPLVAQYLNGTWTYPVSSSNAPANLFNRVILNSASCSGDHCIAAGTYEDFSGEQLLLVQSRDHGVSWNYAIDSLVGPQPSGENNNSRFLASSCNGSTCIAVGNYVDTNINTLGLIAVTQNAGQSYFYGMDNTHGPIPSDYNSSEAFDTASCTANVCLAAGNYIANTGPSSTASYGIIVRSVDHGSTWRIVVDATHGPQPSNFDNSGNFASVSCSGSVCVAAGSYNDNVRTTPYVIQSTDGGATWTIAIDDTTGPQIPDLAAFGNLFTASCTGHTCFTAGRYFDGSTQFPMLAQSIDGSAWTWAIDSVSSTLPSDYVDNGIFEGSATGQLLKKQNAKETKK